MLNNLRLHKLQRDFAMKLVAVLVPSTVLIYLLSEGLADYVYDSINHELPLSLLDRIMIKPIMDLGLSVGITYCSISVALSTILFYKADKSDKTLPIEHR